MLARRLRVLLAAALLAGWALGAALFGVATPGAVAATLLLGATAPAWVTAIVLALELAVAAVVDPRTPRPSWLALVRLVAHETASGVRAFAWRQPFAAGFPEPALAADPQRPAVLLVHGYACNRAVWTALLDAGTLGHCNVATINLEPPLGAIEGFVAPLQQAIEALRAATGAARVDLVCHSMGGLAARAYLARHGDDCVDRIVTIATPHAGTVFGRLGPGTNASQMAPGSRFLTGLDRATTAAHRARMLCVASRDDNLVVPRASPLLPGARHVLLEGVGHLALLEDPRVWQLVAAALPSRGEAPATPAPGSAAPAGA